MGKVQKESIEIWKYQRYMMVVDFEERLILPTPLTLLTYIMYVIKWTCQLIWMAIRRMLNLCRCCRKKPDYAVRKHPICLSPFIFFYLYMWKCQSLHYPLLRFSLFCLHVWHNFCFNVLLSKPFGTQTVFKLWSTSHCVWKVQVGSVAKLASRTINWDTLSRDIGCCSSLKQKWLTWCFNVHLSTSMYSFSKNIERSLCKINFSYSDKQNGIKNYIVKNVCSPHFYTCMHYNVLA